MDDKATQNRSQIVFVNRPPTSNHKIVKMAPKWTPKWSPNCAKSSETTVSNGLREHSGAIVEPFWSHFGPRGTPGSLFHRSGDDFRMDFRCSCTTSMRDVGNVTMLKTPRLRSDFNDFHVRCFDDFPIFFDFRCRTGLKNRTGLGALGGISVVRPVNSGRW